VEELVPWRSAGSSTVHRPPTFPVPCSLPTPTGSIPRLHGAELLLPPPSRFAGAPPPPSLRRPRRQRRRCRLPPLLPRRSLPPLCDVADSNGRDHAGGAAHVLYRVGFGDVGWVGRPARFGVPRCGAKNAKGVLQGSILLPTPYPVRPA
jgi:hypothetical protein